MDFSWFLANSTSVRDLVLSVAAVGGGYLLWRRTRAVESQTRTAQARHDAQTDADRQERITARFAQAIKHLGHEHLEVRLGAIYALERISKESADDHWSIMQMLMAFVRSRRCFSHDRQVDETVRLPNDIQACLVVLGRSLSQKPAKGDQKNRIIDLSDTDLRGAFDGFTSELNIPCFKNAFFQRTQFDRARLWWVNFRWAKLEYASFKCADLSGADLEGAFLTYAKFEGANLSKANLKNCNVSGADLSKAKNLTQEQIEVANGDIYTLLPEGLRQPELWAARAGEE